MSAPEVRAGTEIIGRYALHGEIASGGMAVVYFGRLLGPVGFSRPVAIKRLRPELAREEHVRAMFIDEARLASRIQHPNVVPTLDVVTDKGDLLLVMEYVHGEPLHHLLRTARRRQEPVPRRIALAIVSAVLHGLHAAHEATTESGRPLNVVHRDVSPQNVLVGVDGVARVLDFGIARAAVRLESTGEGIVKGKLAYMAPEQLGGANVDRRTDVYAAGIILWETLAGRRLFVREDGSSVLVEKMLRGTIEPPSVYAPDTPKLLDAITLHALARNPEQRFATAREMALALEKAGDLARPSEIGDWVETYAAESLAQRRARLRELDMTSASYRVGAPPSSETDLTAPSRAIPDLFDVDVEDGSGSESTRKLPNVMAPLTPQAMAIPPRQAQPPVPRGLVVFAAYASLGTAIVLAALALRWAHGSPASAPEVPPSCAAGLTRFESEDAGIAPFCVDLVRRAVPFGGEMDHAARCKAQGKRVPTQGEREAVARQGYGNVGCVSSP